MSAGPAPHLLGPGQVPYATGFAFGNILPDWSNYYEGGHPASPPGLLYGDWEAGTWWALKSKEMPDTEVGWIALGDTGAATHHWAPPSQANHPTVWRHTCTTVEFTSGTSVLVENGKKVHEVTSPELVRIYKVGKKPPSYPT